MLFLFRLLFVLFFFLEMKLKWWLFHWFWRVPWLCEHSTPMFKGSQRGIDCMYVCLLHIIIYWSYLSMLYYLDTFQCVLIWTHSVWLKVCSLFCCHTPHRIFLFCFVCFSSFSFFFLRGVSHISSLFCQQQNQNESEREFITRINPKSLCILRLWLRHRSTTFF